jgi:plastocyanin
MWHPFFFVINDQNGSVAWANGPSVPMMEYTSNLNQTLEPNVPFTGGIRDVEDPRYPTVLDTPGNYSISSVADFYGYGTPRNLVWSESIKFTVLPEQYSVADRNMPPPLQQFLAGIPATSVKCWDGLELLIKTNTGLPICVKHYTAAKMIERDWAKKAPSQIPVVIMPPGFDDPHSGKTYDPSSINVVIGINNTVRWTNKASSSDTLTSDGFKESNSFGEILGGSTLRPGDTYEFTFTKAGTFGYHGVPHSWNKGKIIVLQQPNHMTSAKTSDPFGITALVIYHPQLACLSSPSNTTLPSCPPNNFYLKINSNSTAYLLGYNICDGESCTKNNDLSVLLPINILMKPDYQMIGLPVNLQWKYGDTVHIQLEVSSNADNKTASLIDLGNSTIVP